jgi:DNA gyrase subunit A
MEVIREELELIRDTYADERQTEIREASADINLEDLINEEDVVVTLSHEGYCKYQPLTDYQAQRRGGRGKSATKMKDEDFIEKLLVANTHDTILCFSDRGRLYWLKVYQLPLASRQSRGRPIINILPLEADEKITTILPVQEYEADKFVFMATANGTVKKTALTEYSRPRANGIIAVNLNEGDRLIGASITNGDDEIMLFSENGKVVRFHENQVRSMGRTATGVRGIKLTDEAKVVSLIVPNHEDNILTITENGFGKRTPQHEYPAKSRATQGVVSIKVSERNGLVVGACQVADTNEIMIISNKGTLVRTRVDEVSVVGRNTQGVRLIRTIEGESVVGLAKIEEIEVDDELEGVEGAEGEALESENTSTESSDSANESEGSEGDTSEE